MRGKKPLVFYLFAIGNMHVCMYVCRIARVFSAAEKADYSVIDELMTLLQRPYEEGPYIHSYYVHTYIHTYTHSLILVVSRYSAAGAEVVSQHPAVGP